MLGLPAHSDAQAKLCEKVNAVEDMLKTCDEQLTALRTKKANALDAAASSTVRSVQGVHVDAAMAAAREIKHCESRRNNLLVIRSFIIGLSDNLIKKDIMNDLSRSVGGLEQSDGAARLLDNCDEFSTMMQDLNTQMMDMHNSHVQTCDNSEDDLRNQILAELRDMDPPRGAAHALIAPRTVPSLPRTPLTILPEAPSGALRTKVATPLTGPGLLL